MSSSEDAVGETFNIATGQEIRIGDLAKWILDLTGNDAGIVFKEKRDWDKKPRLLASIEKAKKILGYEPQGDMKAGLKKTYGWFVDHQREIETSVSFENLVNQLASTEVGLFLEKIGENDVVR